MRSTQLFTCLLVSFASLAAAQDKSVAQVKAAFEKEDVNIKPLFFAYCNLLSTQDS